MRIHVYETQSGEANIDLDRVVAIVRHSVVVPYPPNIPNASVDLHMESGTIFTVYNCDETEYLEMLHEWQDIRKTSEKGSEKNE